MLCIFVDDSTFVVVSGAAFHTGSAMPSNTCFNCSPQVSRIMRKYWFFSSMVTKRVTARLPVS
ncbi:hypothetical protein D3C72_2279170 [compost metagenome]